jgi:hypothetical protein
MLLPKNLNEWPAAFIELYNERAAILEFCGNLSRPAAERLAETDIRNFAARTKVLQEATK